MRQAVRFPLLEVAGLPYDMGMVHGTAFKPLIERSLAVMWELLPVPVEMAIEYAARSIPYCREQAPELMEELLGIADGAGLEMEEIFTLNAGLDLQLSPRQLKNVAAPDCWTTAVSGEATADGRTYVLWTAEDSARWFETSVLLRVEPPGGLPCLMWTFAGFVGRPGLNPHLALSAAAQFAEDCGPGMPYPFICRKALGMTSTADAVSMIAGYRRMAGMAYTLGDADGNIASINTSAGNCRMVDSAPGWTATAGRWAEERHARIGELLRERWGHNALPELQRLQRDHGPGALCAHDGSLAVLTSFICDVSAREMWLTHGNPCENEYVRYAL